MADPDDRPATSDPNRIGVDEPGLPGYVGRFALAHLLVYAVVGAGFLALQPWVPAGDRVAVEFFAPYRPLVPAVAAAQAVRGAVAGIALHPFADRFPGRETGWLALFVVVWG